MKSLNTIKTYTIHFVNGEKIIESINESQLDTALDFFNVTEADNQSDPLITRSGKIIILKNVTYIEPLEKHAC